MNDEWVVELLHQIGENPAREGLRETPARVAKAWAEWAAGYDQHPKDVLKVFEDGAEHYDELIAVSDIGFFSHCEHHLAPIIGTATIAYIPAGRIVGLSKLPRLLNVFAKRLQVQERLTVQVADALMEHVKPLGAACIIKARHLCMESRGIRSGPTWTTTSCLRGVFLTKPEARSELMALVR